MYKPYHKKEREYLSRSQKLIEMLGYPRPSGKMAHPIYQEFLEKFIEPVFGKPDEFGNYIRIVLDETKPTTPITADATEQFPRVVYMCHHDTVHVESTLVGAPHTSRIVYTSYPEPEVILAEKEANKKFPSQKVSLDDFEKYQSIEVWNRFPNKIKIKEVKKVYELHDDGEVEIPDMETTVTKEINDPTEANLNCLGADCTVGIWLQLKMIEAGVPGVYVIHAEEEVGRKGAEFIVQTHKKCIEEKTSSPYYWIDLVDMAISFDRKGFNEIITHQSGRQRCASDAFADSLSNILSPMMIEAAYPELIKSDKGSFTDSYSYRNLIPECINLCVGYNAQHSARESQDIRFACHLLEALIANGHIINDLDGDIVIERDINIIVPATPATSSKVDGKKNHSLTKSKTESKSSSVTEWGRQASLEAQKDSSKTQEQEEWDEWYYNEGFGSYNETTYGFDAFDEARRLIDSNRSISKFEEQRLMRSLIREESEYIQSYFEELGIGLSDLVKYMDQSY